jgi:hypothetical protein
VITNAKPDTGKSGQEKKNRKEEGNPRLSPVKPASS